MADQAKELAQKAAEEKVKRKEERAKQRKKTLEEKEAISQRKLNDALVRERACRQGT